jgi:hypothetical protein
LAKYPGFVFTEIGIAQTLRNCGRLAWGFGTLRDTPAVTGLDIIVVREARIAALYTFVDPPAP